MALHPDQRPKSMEELGEVLFGTREFPTAPILHRTLQRSPWDFVLNWPESFLLWAAGGLLLLSLFATLIH
jgi:hypothetical protein